MLTHVMVIIFHQKLTEDLNDGSFVDVMLNIVGFMSILPPEKAKIDNFL